MPFVVFTKIKLRRKLRNFSISKDLETEHAVCIKIELYESSSIQCKGLFFFYLVQTFQKRPTVPKISNISELQRNSNEKY